MNSENGYRRVRIPKDLDEAISELLRIVPDEDLQKFKDTPEDRIRGIGHFSVGMWMRNNWGLWGKSQLHQFFAEKGIDFADDITGVILVSLWRHLNNQPIDLEGQIEAYNNYWQKCEAGPSLSDLDALDELQRQYAQEPVDQVCRQSFISKLLRSIFRRRAKPGKADTKPSGSWWY